MAGSRDAERACSSNYDAESRVLIGKEVKGKEPWQPARNWVERVRGAWPAPGAGYTGRGGEGTLREREGKGGVPLARAAWHRRVPGAVGSQAQVKRARGPPPAARQEGRE